MSNSVDARQTYYPLFDYLRIVLAMVVMFYHDELFGWTESGNLAVQVFFALSGWLIGGILLDSSVSDLPRFYFNRAMRIWIPYYIALVLLLCASLLKDHLTPKWFEMVFYKTTFVYNIFGPPQLDQFRQFMPLQGTGNHFWSVNAEEQFYLLVPLLLVLLVPLGRSLLLWIALAVAAWWFHIYASIIFGVVAAVAARHPARITAFVPTRVVSFGGVVIFALALFDGMTYVLWSPFFAVSVVLLLAVPGKPLPMGKFLGGMSYPLYLNHWIGVVVGHALMVPFGMRDAPLRHIFSTVFSLAMAAGLYRFVDSRILQMRGRLFTADRGRMVLWLAYGLTAFGIIGGLTIHYLAGTPL